MQTDYKEKSTITVDENDILKMSAKIQQNKSENSVFRKQLDKYFSGAMPSHEVINVCSTPNVLKLLNSTAKKVVLNQKDLENAVSDERSGNTGHTEGHNISKEELYKLSDEIRNPIMILKGNERNKNSVVLITDMVNKNGENVFVPIALDRQNGKISNISTLYGKKNLSKYISEHMSDILSLNIEKTGMLADTGVQFSQSIYDTVTCYGNSIAYSTQNVKHPEQNLQYDNIIDKLGSEGKAEINDDGSFKINNDFYRTLPRDDRTTEVVPARYAMEIMQQLSDKGIEFSAVSRQNDKAAITVHKNNADILKRTADNTAENLMRHDDEKSTDSEKINPEYYKQLKKDERSVIRLPHAAGNKTISALQSAGIPFSAIKSENLTSITVHKDNSQALNQIIGDNDRQAAKEYINSDFFKSLPPDERLYTQISGTDKANELMSELKNNNINFSAVVDKEKNSAKVTVDKKDAPALKKVTASLFSRKAQKEFSDKAKAVNSEHDTRNIAKNKDNQHSI